MTRNGLFYKRQKQLGLFLLLWISLGFTGCIPTTPFVATGAASATSAGPRATTLQQPLLISDDSTKVLEEVITAMGGDGALKQLNINLFKGRGRMVAGTTPVDYRLRTQNALPDRLREEIEYVDAAGQPQVTIISVVKGDKGTVQYNTQVKEMDAIALATWKDVLYANLVMTLAPLRKKPFTIQNLPRQRKEGIMCQGFNVKSPGHRDVTFFVDPETHLPVLIQTTIFESNQMLEMTQELLLRDYKDFNGLKYPTRWVVYLNGNKMQEFLIEEAQFPQTVDDQIFVKP